jgi:hypothetical protein
LKISTSRLALVGLTVFFAGAAAHAQSPAITITGAGDPVNVTQTGTYGYSFTATSDLYVTALGVLDDFGDGLDEAHQVGLFDGIGTLKTVTVSNTSALVGGYASGSTTRGGFRYVSISPVLLTAGTTYSVGAFYDASDTEALLTTEESVVFTSNPLITFGRALFSDAGSLSYLYQYDPNASSTVGYFGPNLQVTAVPEPGVVAFGFLAAGSVLGLIARKRKG